MNENILGQRITMLREEKKISQIQLAKVLNISNTTLSQYESGKRVPSDQIKNQIADYFDVSIDFLLGRTEIRNPYKIIYNKSNLVIKSKNQFNLEDLPEEAIKQIKEYIEFIKQKYNVDKSSKTNKS